jgi:hypothetical protein
LILAASCREADSTAEEVPQKDDARLLFEVKVQNHAGETITPAGLYIFEPERGRESVPVSAFSDNHGIITADLEPGTPALVRIHAAFHRPVYLFLPSIVEEQITATIRPEPVFLMEGETPKILGNFNHYDDFSAVEMSLETNGTWTGSIESDLDSLTYLIDGMSLPERIHGTSGVLQASPVHTAADPGIESLLHNDGSNRFEIQFEPDEFITEHHPPDIRFGDETPVMAAGIAKTYAAMIHQIDSVQVLQKQDETVTESHFNDYLAGLEQIASDYDHPNVELATHLAKANFSDYLQPDEDWVDQIMDDIPANSELWLMHYPVLSELYYHSTRMEDVSRNLWDIYRQHGHESVRGEALFNLLKFHYDRGEDEEWYQAHYDLVRLYPGHMRINYSYNRGFAPEAVVHAGEYFPALEFEPLFDDESTLNPAQNNAPVTILYFWSVEDAASREHIPLLQKLHHRYGEMGLVIHTIAVDKNRDRVKRYHRQNHLPWKGGLEPISSSVIQVLGITKVPHTIILNNENRILVFEERFLGDKNVIESIGIYLQNNL